MKQYELMVIVDPDIGANGAKKRLDEIRKLMKDHKGEIFFEDIWGLKDLSYPIKKRETGFYAVLNFSLDPQELTEMDKTLRLENEVLRHMIITLPKGYEPKSYLNAEEEEEEEKAKAKKDPVKKPALAKKAPVKKEGVEEDQKDEKPEKKEPVKKEAAKKEAKKDTSLEEVDAKLKSIIDNPDINF